MPTNDAELIKSIRSMLLNDDGNIPMVQLQRNNPVVEANNNISSRKVAKAQENAVEGLTCNFGGEDSSSSDDDSSDDKSSDDERSMLVHDEVPPATSNAAGPLINDEFDKGAKDTSNSNDDDVVFENTVFRTIRQRSRSDSESSSSSSGSSSSSSSSSSDGSGSSSSSCSSC